MICDVSLILDLLSIVRHILQRRIPWAIRLLLLLLLLIVHLLMYLRSVLPILGCPRGHEDLP
jgi:hypothetical protein